MNSHSHWCSVVGQRLRKWLISISTLMLYVSSVNLEWSTNWSRLFFLFSPSLLFSSFPVSSPLFVFFLSLGLFLVRMKGERMRATELTRNCWHVMCFEGVRRELQRRRCQRWKTQTRPFPDVNLKTFYTRSIYDHGSECVAMSGILFTNINVK